MLKIMYNVKITSQQNSMNFRFYENVSENTVNSLIDKYRNDQFPFPEWDGESHELNSDEYIRIEKI